jgi:Zn-dependent protease
MQENYLANWVQSLFSALPAAELKGSTMVRSACSRFVTHSSRPKVLGLHSFLRRASLTPHGTAQHAAPNGAME